MIFMTFRDLFPQVMMPAWEIGQQLKTKTHHVYGVHSEPPKTQQNRYRRSSLVLTRQKCGRHFFSCIRKKIAIAMRIIRKFTPTGALE
jgi:hypothetical protein